jgi:hypothetical protein
LPSLQAYSTPFYFYSTPSSSLLWALPYLWGFCRSIYSWVFMLASSQIVSSWLVFNHSIIFHLSMCLNITYIIHSTSQSI